jgi:phospholipid/cholesterol/gamma-HCH transport system substrate-binding protein
MTYRPGFRLRLLAFLVFVAIALAIFVLLMESSGSLNLRSRYSFQAVLPSAITLVASSDVEENGVPVGVVKRVANRGATAVVRIAIDRDKGPIYRDATVEVRLKTLLGESYVDLDPGSPSAGAIADGGDLPQAQAIGATQLDEILSTFTPARRARLQRLLRGFGRGIDSGRGADLNAVLEGASAATLAAAPIAHVLADQRHQLAGLVEDFGTVFGGLSEERSALRAAAVGTLGASRAFAAQRSAVASALRRLGPTLGSARAATAATAGLGRTAPPVLGDLGAALTGLTPAIREMPAAARVAVPALRRLGAVRPSAQKLLRALRTVAGPGERTVKSLATTLRDLRPALATLAPYAPDVTKMLTMMSHAGNRRDAQGVLGVIWALVSTSIYATLPASEKAALDALLKAGAFGLLTTSGFNAYPKPGTQLSPQPFDGHYNRVQRDPGR